MKRRAARRRPPGERCCATHLWPLPPLRSHSVRSLRAPHRSERAPARDARPPLHPCHRLQTRHPARSGTLRRRRWRRPERAISLHSPFTR
eukprot:7391435-Prymnesium_polylepis.2